MTSTGPGVREVFLTACPICAAAASQPVIEFDELAFVRCAQCGLVYKHSSVPQLGVGYEEDYFRFNRAKYLKRWAHRVRKCRRQIIDCLQLSPKAKVLCDIGCSAGYVLEAAKQQGLEPVGVDVSKFAVELCRERGYRAQLGPLSALPLPDASVDIVTLKHTLEHVKDPLGALREIHRVLRPGGVALIVVPDLQHWKIQLMPRRHRAYRPDRRGWQHHVYFAEEHLADAVRRAGFEVGPTGKAIRRSGLRGVAATIEWARYAFMRLYTWFGRVTRGRQEQQVFALKPTS